MYTAPKVLHRVSTVHLWPFFQLHISTMKFSTISLALLLSINASAAPISFRSIEDKGLEPRGEVSDLLNANAFGIRKLKDHFLHHDDQSEDKSNDGSINRSPGDDSDSITSPATRTQPLTKRVVPVPPPGLRIKGASRRLNGFAGKIHLFGGGKKGGAAGGGGKNTFWRSNKNTNMVTDKSKGAGKNFRSTNGRIDGKNAKIFSPKIKFAPKIVINRGGGIFGH